VGGQRRRQCRRLLAQALAEDGAELTAGTAGVFDRLGDCPLRSVVQSGAVAGQVLLRLTHRGPDVRSGRRDLSCTRCIAGDPLLVRTICGVTQASEVRLDSVERFGTSSTPAARD
jgi:hypothetical protein